MALLWRIWHAFNRGVSTETSKALLTSNLTSISHSGQSVHEGGSRGPNHGYQIIA
jgi:hypothetical protein